jgi:hypothetical protein
MITHDIADYLVSNLGFSTGDVFEGFMPDRSGTTISVYQYGGFWPLVATVPNQIERPECHIIIRSDTYDAAMTAANTILKGLHTQGEITINTHRYLYIRALGSPNMMRADYSQDNPQFFVNIDFEIYKEMS